MRVWYRLIIVFRCGFGIVFCKRRHRHLTAIRFWGGRPNEEGCQGHISETLITEGRGKILNQSGQEKSLEIDFEFLR